MTTTNLLIKTPTLLDVWLPATEEEFVNQADAPAAAKLKSYYCFSQMQFARSLLGAHQDMAVTGRGYS